ncbi:MAG: hypothetical protein ACI4JC_01250 [Faecalibacterium sp.]
MKKKRAKKLLMAQGFDRNAANWVIDMDRALPNKETVSVLTKRLDGFKRQTQKLLGGKLSLISVHKKKNDLFICWIFEAEASE